MYTYAQRNWKCEVLFSTTQMIPSRSQDTLPLPPDKAVWIFRIPFSFLKSCGDLSWLQWFPKVCSLGNHCYPRRTHWEGKWNTYSHAWVFYSSNWTSIMSNTYGELSRQIIAGMQVFGQGLLLNCRILQNFGGEMFFFKIRILWLLGIGPTVLRELMLK